LGPWSVVGGTNCVLLAPRRRRLAAYCVEAPFAWDAFQLGDASIVELEFRACDEISDRVRHEHLAGSRATGDTSAEMNGDPADLSVQDRALGGGEANTYVEAETADSVADRASTADCAGRTVERREESVAGRVDLNSAETA